MTALLTYFLTALLVSFLCSLLESVLLSLSIAHVSVIEKEGGASGKLMAELKENINNIHNFDLNKKLRIIENNLEELLK